jgi:sec-independent protein translocase protein TatC
MSFLDHLEDLRWHIIRSLIAIAVLAVLAFIYREFIFQEIIFAPTNINFVTFRALCNLSNNLTGTSVFCIEELPLSLQNRTMTGQFTMAITSSFVIGIIVAFPYIFWEFWGFISPGLYEKEKNLSKGAVFFVTLLFLSGVAFGYYVVTPLSVNFLANFQLAEYVENIFDITSYVTTLIMIVLASGILFQLPIVIYFLTKADVVTPPTLRKYRRHAYVVILIISAIITPPDIFSQILISIPVVFLYEASIYISKAVLRNKRKKEMMEEEQTYDVSVDKV